MWKVRFPRRGATPARWASAAALVLTAASGCSIDTEPTRTEPARWQRVDRLVEDFFEAEACPSLTVGVVHGDGLAYSRAMGVADKSTGRKATLDTIYELGSVGKVLTTSVLVILDDRGQVRVDDTVDRWLPNGVSAPTHPSGGPPMTLGHLATHTSGLPGLPVNVSEFPVFQWRGYSAQQLYDGLSQTRSLGPPGADLVYSSLGTGLLGHLMARASGKPYERLVEDELLRPLGMTDTVIHLREEQRGRHALGYETPESSEEAPVWKYGVLAGCGAHRSTLRDLTKFLAAQWTPGGLEGNPFSKRALSTLHGTRWTSEDGQTAIALGLFITQEPGVGTILGHRGRTAGHVAFLAFVPWRKLGVVVLANRGGREVNVRQAELGLEILREAVAAIEGRGDRSG